MEEISKKLLLFLEIMIIIRYIKIKLGGKNERETYNNDSR